MATSTLYAPAISTTKISILLFYRRIFTLHRFNLLVWFLIWFCIAYIVGICIAALLECVPTQYRWDLTVHGYCINVGAEVVAGSAVSVTTDFIVLLMPIPFVAKLHTPLRRKLQVIGIFLLGGLCV
jgi:hypothetical protein